MEAAPSLPYAEPGLPTVLTLAAFLVLLNVLHRAIDRLLNAGLLAQLLLGAVFGSPLAAILPGSVEMAIQLFGYLGLILLVVEGGMSTRLDILSSPKTLALALLTGCLGMLFPIGLSMLLLPFAYQFSYLESFAVGAALSSTSLGTTFAVISSAAKSRHPTGTVKDDGASAAPSSQGLANTRIGTVLIGAALLDDVVALVLSSVIRTLGENLEGGESIPPWSVARPIVTSFLLLVVTAALARFAAGPLVHTAGPWIERWMSGRAAQHHLYNPFALTLWTAVLCAFVAVAYTIGSTVLLGAFCAGAFLTYVYAKLEEGAGKPVDRLNPHRAYGAIKAVQDCVLAPFFFASIGAAIPIRDLFRGETVWKGVLYSGLMAIAKVMACLPILGLSMVTKKHARRVMSALGLRSRAALENTVELVRPSRPWLPALFLGFSLVARGEVSRRWLPCGNRSLTLETVPDRLSHHQRCSPSWPRRW